MEQILQNQMADKHIRDFPQDAWRIAKAAAQLTGLNMGTWIAQAIIEKWSRDQGK